MLGMIIILLSSNMGFVTKQFNIDAADIKEFMKSMKSYEKNEVFIPREKYFVFCMK